MYLHIYVYSTMVQLTKYWVSTQLFRFTSEKNWKRTEKWNKANSKSRVKKDKQYLRDIFYTNVCYFHFLYECLLFAYYVFIYFCYYCPCYNYYCNYCNMPSQSDVIHISCFVATLGFPFKLFSFMFFFFEFKFSFAILQISSNFL